MFWRLFLQAFSYFLFKTHNHNRFQTQIFKKKCYWIRITKTVLNNTLTELSGQNWARVNECYVFSYSSIGIGKSDLGLWKCAPARTSLVDPVLIMPRSLRHYDRAYYCSRVIIRISLPLSALVLRSGGSRSLQRWDALIGGPPLKYLLSSKPIKRPLTRMKKKSLWKLWYSNSKSNLINIPWFNSRSWNGASSSSI